MKNATVIHKDGEDPKETFERLKKFDKGMDESKDFQAALQALKAAKSDEERRKAEERVRELASELAKKHGVTEDIARQRVETVKKSIEEMAKDQVQQKIDKVVGAAPDQKPTAVAEIKKDAATVASNEALMQALRQKAAAVDLSAASKDAPDAKAVDQKPGASKEQQVAVPAPR
jgi:poly-D-alanine transfer protein DltD